ncbi:MBL fold metallo-hydrolase [Candidatus Saccharibacteria bacterium]|nr:MAG: MBL fold metallo-hydrolase [Candidatus Saccharibacteria bacterium]
MKVKITKYGHSCVLVEGEQRGKARVALFDPGGWSDIPTETIEWLDDVFISHIHGDHCDPEKLRQMVAKFPDVRITAPTEVVEVLRQQGFTQAAGIMPEGAVAFVSPHEEVSPFGAVVPEELGVHFLGVYTHPGDCHQFAATMPILALPIVAPWGSTRRALELALELKPKYALPVHDWFLSPEAREWTYEGMESVLSKQGITLLKPKMASR